MFVNTGCDVFSLCYYFYSFLWYVIIIYIPTYGLCFRTQIGAGPLCFWREDLTPQQGQGSTLVNPWSWRSCIIQDWPWRSSGVKVVPWCPVVHPHSDPNRIYYSCFLPMSVPGPVRFPTTKNGGVIQENCHLLLLDFFLVTPKGAKKDRDGCWTNTSHLASLEHVMCYGLKMFKDIFKLFQVVSDCNNTKFNISYVSFLSKYLSH